MIEKALQGGRRYWAWIIFLLAVITMGFVFYLPTRYFKNIAITGGDDISDMMLAFTKLDRGWLMVNIATALNRLVQFYLFIDIVLHI